ncbi:hypothetical protein EDC04DRAFT_2606337 [Pisolithus marmoratus]|nr:hypothetical protein EDC04DRAFT_2606337 [Pisolithus marmoratus]
MQHQETKSPVPHGWQMHLTEKIAEYMQSQFCQEVFFGPQVLPDISIPVPLLLQANHMLRTIVQAYQNPFVVCETQCGKTQDTTASLPYEEITAASVVLDENGNIKLWYLPGAIDYTHQDCETSMKNIWNSLHGMSVALEDGLKPSCQHGWHNDQILFCEMADLRGSIDCSPGWYQQGHGPKSVKPGEEVKFHPEVLWLLKSGRKPNGMQQWVDQMSDIHALLSGTLAVIHPWMFAAGWEALIWLGMEARTWEDTDMSSILQIWNSVYNCASIMVNHTTPYHTDINGWEPWLDMLMTVGDYMLLDMVIPMLKL